jgi:hypothetical protein
MLAIRGLLEVSNISFHDKGLPWGVKASAYHKEIIATIRAGSTPVLVEMADDLELGSRVMIVDHHNGHAGGNKPSSLRQVFELIHPDESQWTRRLALVDANDVGYIPAMRTMGASKEGIRKIREEDRLAQGVILAEELPAEDAVQKAVTYENGRLIVIDLPHARATIAADIINIRAGARGEKAPDNILVLCPDETVLCGSGEIINALRASFPQGWKGGALPRYGFWGVKKRLDIVDYVVGHHENQ